jgi:hypothetical protein
MKRIAIALALSTLCLSTGISRASQVEHANPAITLTGTSKPVSPVRADVARKVSDLQFFSHLARIPVDSNAGTIRFEKAKLVQVPTSIIYTMNQGYCDDLAFRDPGGSMYCQQTQTGSTATAYEVTYSYIGQPMSSDEFGNRNALDARQPFLSGSPTSRIWPPTSR